MTDLHAITTVRALVSDLFSKAGMDEEKAVTVTDLLILTDRLGRKTHGVAMAPLYLADIEKGGMTASGSYDVVSDTGVAAVWDGDYLPGLWLMKQAIEAAAKVARTYGVGTIALRKTHHIGCLAALSTIATDQGLIAFIANSDPAGARVAPYGGTEALYTPNPIALGYPSSPNSVLVDICASITTTSMTREKHARGERFDEPWLMDHDGNLTTDPSVLEQSERRGSLLPVGGLDHGHKGFGLGIMIEALSQGLSGHGRADAPKRWGGNVLLQVFDPEKFAGADAFARQVDYFGDKVRANKPRQHGSKVRMPGDNARAQLDANRETIPVHPSTVQALNEWAAKLCVERL